MVTTWAINIIPQNLEGVIQLLIVYVVICTECYLVVVLLQATNKPMLSTHSLSTSSVWKKCMTILISSNFKQWIPIYPVQNSLWSACI